MALADEIAQQHDLDRTWVRRVIGKARHVPQLAKLVVPPPVTTPRNWQQYRSRFLEAERVQAGVAFWRTHETLLQRASSTYGVPPEIIVGIIGVETYYGRHLGRYRVLDTLATLALDFPPEHPRAAARSAFFRAELGEFLKQRHGAGLDPFKARGSYAGAMGIPQFMPSSWARYAVDFDGDGRIDLLDSPADAIGSVAHYFKAFNWKPGMPTHYTVDFDYSRLDMPTLLAPDIKPTFGVEQFAAKGVVLGQAARQHEGPLALVELQNGDYSPSYVAGTENFYVVTRYNWSSYYALAVIELGQAVAMARQDALALQAQPGSTDSNTGCRVSTQRSTSLSPICR
ncbi:MAG: lytic murein transglycosylase B [Curvibacter sp.]